MLFSSGDRTSSRVKFRGQICIFGDGIQFVELTGEGLLEPIPQIKKMVDNSEAYGVQPYAIAVQVDGIRRTLDLLMKQQQERNIKMQTNIDYIVQFLNTTNGKQPTTEHEDKGSNIKGKNLPPTQHSFHHVQHQHTTTAQKPSYHYEDFGREPLHYQSKPHWFTRAYYYEEPFEEDQFDGNQDWQQHPWNIQEEEDIGGAE